MSQIHPGCNSTKITQSLISAPVWYFHLACCEEAYCVSGGFSKIARYACGMHMTNSLLASLQKKWCVYLL